MTLYWPDDPNKIDLTTPRLHAFIIGVGEYPHLMGGGGHPAVANFGLQQLTTTVLTAKRIAEWLRTEYTNPTVPLGSIELLLSPAEQVTPAGGTPIGIDRATMQAVDDTFRHGWFPRCNAQQGNIAFFYFAGHGISTASQYLLLDDFGDPQKPNLWANCIDFDGMRVGMRRNNADTQLFFIDACREKPIDALVQLNPNGNPLVTSSVFDQVGAYAVYHAAADGLQAYGPSNDVTFFGSAVLEALGGAGALQKNGQWVVDTFMLGSALGHIMNVLATEHNQALSCNPNASGKPVPLHCPPTPRVRVSVGCRTPQANAEAQIVLQQGGVVMQSPRGDPRPWKGRLTPGDCHITLDFQTMPQVVRHEKIGPPLFELEVGV